VNFVRKFRDAAIVATLLAIPFFFLKANLTDPAQTTWLDELILKASSPIQYVTTEAARGVSDILEEYVYLVEVEEDNQTLHAENARLEQQVRELRREGEENVRLRELIALRETTPGETLSAQVIGKEVSNYFRVTRIRLDRGERDLVRAGMPVLSPHGLVGQIRRTWGRYSDVLLAVDRTSRIDVVVERTRARGMLVGTGDDNRYACRIEYLERTDEIEVGDEVFTSGLGQRFPAGVLVGTVTRVERQDFGLYQEAEVTPTVDFSDLDEVFVLTAGSREQVALGADDEER
jgi:rod shape-determining protein MreC